MKYIFWGLVLVLGWGLWVLIPPFRQSSECMKRADEQAGVEGEISINYRGEELKDWCEKRQERLMWLDSCFKDLGKQEKWNEKLVKKLFIKAYPAKSQSEEAIREHNKQCREFPHTLLGEETESDYRLPF